MREKDSAPGSGPALAPLCQQCAIRSIHAGVAWQWMRGNSCRRAGAAPCSEPQAWLVAADWRTVPSATRRRSAVGTPRRLPIPEMKAARNMRC